MTRCGNAIFKRHPGKQGANGILAQRQRFHPQGLRGYSSGVDTLKSLISKKPFFLQQKMFS